MHLLQLLDIGLFGPLQHFYGIGVEHFRDYGESFGFAPQHFLPIYLEACRKAYSLANIESAFRTTGMVPLNSRILTKPRVNPEVQGELESVLLEKTPYTKCQLCQQTNAALAFVKTATPGRSEISFFTFPMLLNRALLRRKLQIAKQVGCALN